MPKYIVKGGNWGEGYVPGDEIELDTNAARVRLEKGEIEPVPTKKEEPKKEAPKTNKKTKKKSK